MSPARRAPDASRLQGRLEAVRDILAMCSPYGFIPQRQVLDYRAELQVLAATMPRVAPVEVAPSPAADPPAGEAGGGVATSAVPMAGTARGRVPALWTAERTTTARRMWEAGDDPVAIMEAANALPGMRMHHPSRVLAEAARRGWLRPWEMEAPSPPAEASTATEPQPEPPSTAGAREMAADGLSNAPDVLTAAGPELARLETIVRCVTGPRAEAEALLRGGMSGRDVAQELDLSLSDVSRWVGELRDQGELP